MPTSSALPLVMALHTCMMTRYVARACGASAVFLQGPELCCGGLAQFPLFASNLDIPLALSQGARHRTSPPWRTTRVTFAVVLLLLWR